MAESKWVEGSGEEAGERFCRCQGRQGLTGEGPGTRKEQKRSNTPPDLEEGKKGEKKADEEAWRTSLREENEYRLCLASVEVKIPVLRTVTVTPSETY